MDGSGRVQSRSESARRHLWQALDATADDEARFHIRQALQLLQGE